jgi:ATP-dependent Clp protease ATP-binding subunit ClpC
MLDDLAGVLSDKGIETTYTDAAADFVAAKSFSRKYGARNMRRFIEANIEDKLADKIISSYDTDITSVVIDKSEESEELNVICR